jgi:hypothetical protein
MALCFVDVDGSDSLRGLRRFAGVFGLRLLAAQNVNRDQRASLPLLHRTAIGCEPVQVGGGPVVVAEVEAGRGSMTSFNN